MNPTGAARTRRRTDSRAADGDLAVVIVLAHEAVEAGLRTLVKIQSQAAIRAARGTLHWEGDLDAMRRDK